MGRSSARADAPTGVTQHAHAHRGSRGFRRRDGLVCGGDLYEHDRFSPDTAEFLRDTFNQLERPVFLAPGNHDWYGPVSLYRQVNWSPKVHVFTEPALAPVELADGFTLWGAAHCAPAKTAGFLDGFRVNRGGVNVALFHGSERSALGWQEAGKAPHAPFDVRQVTESGLDHALLGHVHSAVDAARHTYPGNPDPLTFGESANRGAVIVTVDADGALRRERHAVATSVVHDVTVTLDGVTHSGQVRDRVAEAVSELSGICRVTLTGEVAPDVDVQLPDLAGVAPHLEALVPRLDAVRVAYDFAQLADQRTVQGQFVSDVLGADLDEDVRRRVLVTGLRALHGRKDELEVH